MSLLLGVTSSQASEQIATETTNNGLFKRYRNVQPIHFVERGVSFYVFPNGEFDFNTHRSVYRRGRRGGVNTTFGAPGVRFNYNSRRAGFGIRIEHDRFGKIRRVGNTFVNYDRFGRVKRIGSVYMRYGRHGNLTQIGGLQLRYSRWGRLLWHRGNVKPGHCGIYGSDGYDNIGFGDDFNDWDNDDWDDDDQFYYRNRGQQRDNDDD